MWALECAGSVLVAHVSCPMACGILVPQPAIELASPAMEHGFFFKDLFIIYIFIYFWLCRVLVAAHGIFFAAWGLFVVARSLLSSCGRWVFLSLVLVCMLQGMWAL